MTQRSCRCLARYLRAAAAVAFVASVGSCVGGPSSGDRAARGDSLQNNLSVAAAHSPPASHRSPAGCTGLWPNGSTMLRNRSSVSVTSSLTATTSPREGLFRQSRGTGERRAGGEDGSGSSAQDGRRSPKARRRGAQHFRKRASPGKKLPLGAWVANGIGVLATSRSRLRKRPKQAMASPQALFGTPTDRRESRAHAVGGRNGRRCCQTFAQHDPSYWLDDDGRLFSRMIEEARRERQRQPRPVVPNRGWRCVCRHRAGMPRRSNGRPRQGPRVSCFVLANHRNRRRRPQSRFPRCPSHNR